MNWYKRKSILSIVACLLLLACYHDDLDFEQIIEENRIANNRAVADYFQEWYLWNQQLPDINPDDYANIHDLIRDLRYQPELFDRFTSLVPKEEFDALYRDGQMEGYGFMVGQDMEGHARVSMVFQGSPLYVQGVRRGSRMLRVDGLSADSLLNSASLSAQFERSTLNFTFLNATGDTLNFDASRQTVQVNAVQNRQVFSINNQKIGYLSYQRFTGTSEDELKESFAFFQANQISDLILDLRYNNGGLIRIAGLLGDFLGSGKLEGKIHYQMLYNEDKSNANSVRNFEESEVNLNLNSITFLTTRRTASASEIIINGLSPHMDVNIVGQRSAGKPVGSRSFSIQDDYLLLVILRLANALDVSDYFLGFFPNHQKEDDLNFDWGDPREGMLRSALRYYETGSFSEESGAGRLREERPQDPFEQLRLRGWKEELGAF